MNNLEALKESEKKSIARSLLLQELSDEHEKWSKKVDLIKRDLLLKFFQYYDTNNVFKGGISSNKLESQYNFWANHIAHIEDYLIYDVEEFEDAVFDLLNDCFFTIDRDSEDSEIYLHTESFKRFIWKQNI